MKKKVFLKFRCTSLEKEIIKKKAKNSGLSMSEFTRSSALGQTLKSKFTEEEFEVYLNLIKFNKNFQSLSNLFKAKDPSLSNLTQELALDIKQILKELQ